MATLSFTLVTIPNKGKGYGNIFLLSNTPGYTQTIQPNTTIKFNGFTRLATMSWKTADTITMLKAGLYQINFQVNYETNFDTNVQVGLYVNGNQINVFGESIPLDNGVSKLSGTYVLKVKPGDLIQFAGIGDTFVISPVSQSSEIIASVTIVEVQ